MGDEKTEDETEKVAPTETYEKEITEEYDNSVAILRTIIVGINVLTCLIIIANIIHNW